MKPAKESLVLSEIRRAEPKKKRVTFFISTSLKDALALWCEEHDVTESSAVEAMIKTTVPPKYFKGGK